jgi:predicted GNAT family acetyltransferase
MITPPTTTGHGTTADISPLPAADITQQPIAAPPTPDVNPIPPTTELDLTLGAPIPNEEEAFRAWSDLTGEKTTGKPLDAEYKQKAVSTWTTYRDLSKTYNRPLFPSKTSQHYAKLRDQEKRLLSGVDAIFDQLPADQSAALQKRLAAFPKAARPNEIARTALYSLFQQQYGKAIKPDAYPALRDTYARQVLGLTDDTSDLAVYTEVKKRHDERLDLDKNLQQDTENLTRDALAGMPVDIKAQTELYQKNYPAPLAEAATMELRTRVNEARRLHKSVEPIAKALYDFIAIDAMRYDETLKDKSNEAPIPQGLGEAAFRFSQLTPEQKAAVNAFIMARTAKAGEDPEATATRIINKFKAGNNSFFRNVALGIQRAGIALEGGMDENTARTWEEWVQSSGFLKDKTTRLAGKFNREDGILTMSALSASEQLPYMMQVVSGPLGYATTVTSLAGSSYENARIRNPEGNDTTQFFTAVGSAVAQASIERFAASYTFRHLGAIPGFRSTFGKQFGSESLFRLAKIENRLARAAAGAAIGAASVGVVEYGEEIAQDVVDRTLQDLATLPTGLTDDEGNPTTLFQNIKTTAGSWFESNEKTQKMLLSLLPFMLIGGGGGSFSSFRNGTQLQQNRAAMRVMGLPESVIEEISTTPDVAKADSLLRQAVQTELHMKSKEEAITHAQALADFTESIEQAWEAQGVQIINPTFDEAGNVVGVELQIPNRETTIHNSVEEAQQALYDYKLEEDQRLMESGTEAATISTVDFLVEDGQVNSAEEAGTAVNFLDFEGTFDEMLKRGLATSEELKQRLTAYAMQQGISIAEANKHVKSGALKIRARSFAKQTERGSWQYTVDLFRGADPINAMEDFAETFWKAAVNNDILSIPKAIGWIRAIEQRTGNSYLPADYEHSTENEMLFWEALSALSKEYALHNYRANSFPAEFRRWIESMLTTLGTAWEWFKAMLRGRDLQEAIKDGTVPKQFAEMIADSVGISEENRATRVMRRESEQARADFEETGYKLSEWAKGKLLHPAQARAMDHPLRRELERIYDGLTTFRQDRRAREIGNIGKRKEWKKNVSRADAYFAPRTEKVNMDNLRGSANELGFQFENIAEMLEAIEDALFYNRETHSTHSGIVQQSFSISAVNDGKVGALESGVIDRITNNHIDHHSGQDDFEIVAYKGNDVMGYLSYTDFEGEIRVEMVQVRDTHKRQGIATELYKKLVSLYPETTIESTFRTEDGNALRKALARIGILSNEGRPLSTNQSDSQISFSLSREADSRAVPQEDPRPLLEASNATIYAQQSFSISALHATPHKVDKFTLDKIGTGEGAQAYGYGLYFAESEAVSGRGGTYDSQFSNSIRYDGRTLNWGDSPTAESIAAELLDSYRGDPDAKKYAIDDAEGYENAAQIKKIIRSMEPSKIERGANIYTVTLDVEPEDLLDWDKPLSEQSEKIKAIWKTITKAPEGNAPMGQWYRFYSTNAWNDGIDSIEQASAALLAAGIKGIRYLDGNSRSNQYSVRGAGDYHTVINSLNGQKTAEFEGADSYEKAIAKAEDLNGQGTYNYVIFDDSLITITEENGNPVNLAEAAEQQSFSLSRDPSNPSDMSDSQASFSLSRDTQNNLQTIIEARLSRGPEERVKILETMRDRLQGITAKLEARNAGDLTPMERQLLGWRGKELTPAQAERLRIEDALATVKGLLSALPTEIRAKVSIPLSRILDADSDVKTYNAFRELIQNADEVIESELKDTYIDRITTLLDTARPTSTEQRTNKTLLTPDTQRALDQIDAIVEMSDADLMMAEILTEAELQELETQILAAQAEGDADLAQQILIKQIEVQQYMLALSTYGKISQQSSSELARTYQQLKDLYIRGRQIRKMLDEAKRNETREAREDIKASLGYPDGVSGPVHDRATTASTWKNVKDYIKAIGVEHMSFHEFMEVLFPGSFTVQDWSRRAVKAMRGVKRRRLAAEQRFNEFFATRLGATTHMQRTKILEELSTRRSRDWQMNEVIRRKKEKIPVDYVPQILAGKMKLGWTDDILAMTLLKQAWRDFQMLPAKKRERTQNLTLMLPTERRLEGADTKSELELLDVLMTYEQESYRPALDQIGYTEEVMEKLIASLDPRAKAIHEFLRKEYADGWFDMNRVFQRVFNMDMPQIRNYAPGTFENAKLDTGKEAAGSLLGSTGATSAMGAGATKNRRAHAARPLTVSALSKYWAHTEQTAYWMEWTELISEVSRVLRSPDVRRAIEARHGKKVATDVGIWIDMLNNDGSSTAQQIISMERAFANIINTQSHIALAFNLAVPFKQASAALGSLTMVPATSAMKTFAKLIFRWSDMKKIFQSEAIQQRILAGISPESKALMDATRMTPSRMMDALSVGQLHTSLTDAAFTTISGLIAYDYHLNLGLKQGLSPQAAENFALEKMDYVVARTSQPADTQMKSLVELKAGHGLGKLVIQFKSDPRRAMGAVLSALYQHHKGTLPSADLARIITTQWIIYGLLGQLGTSVFKSIAGDDEKDEDNWKWEEFLLAALLGPIEGFFLFGTVISNIAKKIAGQRVFDSNLNPLDKYIQTGMNAIAKKDASEFFMSKAFLDAIGSLGSAVGMPGTALIPSLVRGINQLAQMGDNLITTPEEELAQWAREFDAQEKKSTETTKESEDAIFTRAIAATGTERDKILAELPDDKQRRRLRDRIKKHEAQASMNDLEKSLFKLSAEKRLEKAKFIDSKITNEEQREAFRNRMSLLFDLKLE